MPRGATLAAVDTLALKDAASGPGIDPRQWLSYGTVDPETADEHSVTFDPDMGPLVDVTLQPSGIPVVCRVAGWCMGAGESEYYPFLQGDEVVVGVPEGDETAGCVILGRCNNQIDKFPTTVAGADVTKNNFAFRRTRVPFVWETASSWGLRNAATSALFMMGKDGTTTLSDGYLGFLHMGPDFVGLQATDAPNDGAPFAPPGAYLAMLQLDRKNKLATLEVQGKAKLTIGTKLDGLSTAGRFFVQTGGAATSEHVTTVEAVANIIANVFAAYGAALATVAAPLTGSALSVIFGTPLTISAVTQTIVAAAMTGAATPLTGTLNPALVSAIKAALAGKVNNTTGTLPNVGCPGFLSG